MADDIVPRLLRHALVIRDPEHHCMICLAAEEIARLRTAGDGLARAADDYTTLREYGFGGDYWDVEQPVLIAALAAWQEARRG